MNTIIRGEEAWDRLEKLPQETQGYLQDWSDESWFPSEDACKFVRALEEVSGKHLHNIVAAMHDRLIHEREIANLQLMLLLDVYPWRHQIAFVFTQRYRGKYKQTGERWWLPTVLATKIEDIALPAEAEAQGVAHEARTELYRVSEGDERIAVD